MGLGHVAASARPHRQRRPAVAGHRDDDAIGRDDRGRVDQCTEALARPKFLAGLRVEALDLLRHAKNEFYALADLGDDGRAPGADPFGVSLFARLAARLIMLPDLLAGLLAHGTEELPLAGPAPEIKEVAVNYRRRRVTPDVNEL